MSKEDVIKKIKAILAKDKQFKSAKVKVSFADKQTKENQANEHNKERI